MTTASRAGGSVGARIDELMHRAKAETGLDDFGGDSWREGLEILVRAAIAEASFNDLGEQMFYDSLVRPLVNRLKIEDWYRRHPEIDDQEVRVEFLGVGFPRTGSTALSHLIAEDPAFRILRIWEETSPCPPPGVSAEDDEARVAAARMGVEMGQRTYGHATALDAAAVGDRSHGGPRHDGPRVHRAVLPRVGPRPDLRGVVPPVRHGTDVPLREASPEATPVEDPREGVAAQEPDAHPLPGGVREGLPGRALRPDPPRRVQGAAVRLGSVLHDAAGRQR